MTNSLNMLTYLFYNLSQNVYFYYYHNLNIAPGTLSKTVNEYIIVV